MIIFYDNYEPKIKLLILATRKKNTFENNS